MIRKWYKTSNILRIKKRKDYYEVYIVGCDKPLLVDYEDLKILKGLKLKYDGNYVCVGKTPLHKIIQIGPVIHHINRNKLDNRKKNLEICQTNREHIRKHMKNPKSTIWKQPNPELFSYEEDEPFSKKDLITLKFLGG